jgi:hypothetical protein
MKGYILERFSFRRESVALWCAKQHSSGSEGDRIGKKIHKKTIKFKYIGAFAGKCG